MKLLPPLEISARVMTLIEESEKQLIVVSPYIEIRKWDKMQTRLLNALERNVNIQFYVRENAKQDLSFLTAHSIPVTFIKNLHSKLYISDNIAIVTSQNMIEYSDINSIDIAYQTETKNEWQELIDYAQKYIVPKQKPVKKSSTILKIENEVSPDSESLAYFEQLLLAGFPNCKLTNATTYLFSKNIIPGIDLMLYEKFTIKGGKLSVTIQQCQSFFTQSTILSNYNLKLSIKDDHNKYTYLDIESLSKIDAPELYKSYIQVLKELKSYIEN